MSARRTVGGPSLWDRVADLVMRRPGRTLALSLLPVVLPILALPFLNPTHDLLASLPGDADSIVGLRALDAHMPSGETGPVLVVIDHDASVFEAASFRALGDLSRNLRRLPGVASVRSAAMPTDGRRPEVDDDLAAEAAALGDRLEEAAQGARRLADGVEQVGGGLAEIDERLPGLSGGLDDAREGTQALLDGVRRVREGVGALRAGLAELTAGLGEARDGAARLRDDVAVPTAAALERAVDALRGFTVGSLDPRYPEAFEAVGEAYGRVTGRYPEGHPQAGEPVQPGYDGLASALDDLSAGLGEAVEGARGLEAGLRDLDGGLGELEGGLAALADGLAEAGAGTTRLHEGIRELRAGVEGDLLDGARRLAQGLAEGVGELERTGLAELALGEDEGPFVLTRGLLDAAPDIREQLEFFVADGETRTRVFVGLSAAPFSDAAIVTVRQVEQVARTSLLQSPLQDAEVVVTGPAAFVSEVSAAASRDFPIIVTAVILGVFVVLVLMLRSLVAPLFMVATVLLSYAATLGIATIVFQGLLGQPGIQWWIPPLLFVMLVALGVDYSIFLMGRVREEAQRRITRDAVGEGVRHTGGVITSAGVILAGTFGALMAAPLRSLAQFGFAAMIGILLDTFVVRALVVPSIAVLLGRWNWWPSARSSAH